MRTNLGKTYRSKKWAKRWARGRPIRKVKGGWRIGKARKRKARKSKKRLVYRLVLGAGGQARKRRKR